MPRSLLVCLAFVVAACRGGVEDRSVTRPSPSASARPSPSPCASPSFAPGDPEVTAWFPVRVGQLCVDRNAVPRRFGGTGEPALETGCESVGLDCTLLERLGLSRIVSLRYLDQRGAGTGVLASVLAFRDAEAAYGFFTDRLAAAAVLGKPQLHELEAPGAAVLGDTRATLVRAAWVLSLELSNTKLTPDQVTRAAAGALPELAHAVGDRLPGDPRLPAALRALPVEHRVALSERYDAFDLFGVVGVGRGARARYVDAGRSYELAALVRAEPDAAGDVLKTLRKLPGAFKIKDGPYESLRFRLDDGTGVPTEWVFGRKGALVLGAGAAVEPTLRKRHAPKPPDRKLLLLKRTLDERRGSPD